MTSAAATASRAGSRWLSRKAAPVDAGFVGVDLLLGEPVRELLDAPIELALDQRRRDFEWHPCRELLHQLAPDLQVRGVPRLVLQILADAGPQRVERLERPQVLGELVVELGDRAALDALHRHRV